MIGNQIFWVDVLYISLFSYCFVLFSFLIGSIFINTFSNNNARKAFYNTVFGAIALISFFSFAFVGIKTVNTIAIILLIYFSLSEKKYFKADYKTISELLPLIYIIPIVIICYSMYAYPESINNDFKYYSKIAYQLPKNKYENFYHFYNTYANTFNGVTPYHYTELWLAAIFNLITNSLSVIALKNFSYPLIISFVAFGFIINTTKNKILILILLLTLSIFPLGKYLSVVNIGWNIITDFWQRPNFIMYYLLLTLCYNSVMDKNWKLFYLIISIGFTFSFVLVPGTLVALIALNIYLKLFFKISWKQIVKNLYLPIFIALGLIILYKIYSPSINVTTQFDLFQILLYNVSIWKAIIWSILVLLLQGAIIPVLFYFFQLKFNNNDELKLFGIFIIILLVIGVFMFQLLTQIDNAYQFAYFGYAAIGFVFMALCISVLEKITFNNTIVNCTIILVSVLIIYISPNKFTLPVLKNGIAEAHLINENMSTSFKNKFKKYLYLNTQAKGAFIYHSSVQNKYQPKDRHCLTKQIGSSIAYLTNNCNLPSITCYDILHQDLTNKNSLQFKKLDTWINAFPLYTKVCNPIYYLQNKSIDYFICPINYPLPNNVKIITDSLSQLKMVYL